MQAVHTCTLSTRTSISPSSSSRTPTTLPRDSFGGEGAPLRMLPWRVRTVIVAWSRSRPTARTLMRPDDDDLPSSLRSKTPAWSSSTFPGKFDTSMECANIPLSAAQ
ncbi:unnamed protein product, partial [Ectocarpus sp. 12 AP-2014]